MARSAVHLATRIRMAAQAARAGEHGRAFNIGAQGSPATGRPGAKSLRALGVQGSRLTEEWLREVGRFRLSAHQCAEREFRGVQPALPG